MLKNLAAPYEFLGGGTGRKKAAGKAAKTVFKTSERGGNTMEIRGYVSENQGISEG